MSVNEKVRRQDIAWLKRRRTLAMQQAREDRRRWDAGGHLTNGGRWVEYDGRELDATADCVARNVRDARFYTRRIVALRKEVRKA